MRAAGARGLQLVEVPLADEVDGFSGIVELRRRQVDGIVIGWPDSASQVEAALELGLPVVQVMKPVTAEGSATITVDTRPGVDAAVSHLVSLGHEHIAYVGLDSDHPVEVGRRTAFSDALAACGRSTHADLIELSTDRSLRSGWESTRRLLARARRPTAMIVGDGLLGALRALYEERLWLPTDFSIIGFDDELGASIYPPLSSIRQPIAEVADRAAMMIERWSTGEEDLSNNAVVVDSDFVVRGSTGSMRESAR